MVSDENVAAIKQWSTFFQECFIDSQDLTGECDQWLVVGVDGYILDTKNWILSLNLWVHNVELPAKIVSHVCCNDVKIQSKQKPINNVSDLRRQFEEVKGAIRLVVSCRGWYGEKGIAWHDQGVEGNRIQSRMRRFTGRYLHKSLSSRPQW
jgi:hypothetical protein